MSSWSWSPGTQGTSRGPRKPRGDPSGWGLGMGEVTRKTWRCQNDVHEIEAADGDLRRFHGISWDSGELKLI